ITEKCEPLSIRRPAGIGGRLVAARQLKTLSCLVVDQTNLRDESILFEVAIVDGVGDPFAVRRDLRASDEFDREQFIDGWNMTLCLSRTEARVHESEKTEQSSDSPNHVFPFEAQDSFLNRPALLRIN